MDSVILVGGFPEMVELCVTCNYRVIGAIELEGETGGVVDVLGTDADAPVLKQRYPDVPLVLSPESSERRKVLAEEYSRLGFSFARLIHPSATVSDSARLGQGVVIQAGAIVSTNCQVGDFARVHFGGILLHDVSIGACSNIAPGAVVLGRVKVGEGAFIVANATVLSGRTVGDGAIVGAGAVVTRDVEDSTVVVGCPARPRG